MVGGGGGVVYLVGWMGVRLSAQDLLDGGGTVSGLLLDASGDAPRV